tara:strand:+ start:202 stop:747 length:546 start_codon:yes stop_codon:yes gene_type:complete
MKNILKTLKVSYERLLWFFNIKGRLANFIEDVVCKLESQSSEMEETARWVFNEEISDTNYEVEELAENVRYMKDNIKDDLLSDFDDKFDTIKDGNIIQAIEDDVKYIAQQEASEYFDKEINYYTEDLEGSLRSTDEDVAILDKRVDNLEEQMSELRLTLEEKVAKILSEKYTVELTLKPKE